MAAAIWAASRVLEVAGALATENTKAGIGAEVPGTVSPFPLTCAQEQLDAFPVAG